MKRSTTFSIFFWIDTVRAKNNLAKLYVRITVNGIRTNVSLKYNVLIEDWDTTTSRLKETSAKAIHINDHIDEVSIGLMQSFQELKSEDKLITAQLVKNRFLGIDKKFYSMQDIITYHNEKVGYKLNKYTMRHYKTSQKYIMEFIMAEYKTSDMYLRDLNYRFIIEFENFIRSYESKGHSPQISNNTTMKHIQRLRKMVTLAYHMEWIDKDPFIKFKQSFVKNEKEYLTDEEIDLIETAIIDNESLQMVRDLFIFSCYTGIAYIDVMQLTKDNIVLGIDGKKWVVTSHQKSSKPVRIPLLKKALQIIEKYENDIRVLMRGTLFPKMSNQKINSYLKELASMCGISKKITFHVARHTFATTITLSNGVPIETVSKMLGHSRLTTTQIYARVVEKKISEDMLKISDKYESKNKESFIKNKTTSL
jgi:site-specific recombinase XerD